MSGDDTPRGNTLIFGIPIGSWIQWSLPIAIGISVSYFTAILAPIDASVKESKILMEEHSKLLADYKVVRDQCEKRIDNLEKVFELQRDHMMKNYQTKEQSSRDFEHIMRLLENARR
jgi:hypothetical protein